MVIHSLWSHWITRKNRKVVSVLCPCHFTCCRQEQVSYPLYCLFQVTCNRDLVKSCMKLTILAWTQGTHNLGKVFTKSSSHRLDNDLNYLILVSEGFFGLALFCFLIFFLWYDFPIYTWPCGSYLSIHPSIHLPTYLPPYLPTYIAQNSHGSTSSECSVLLWKECTTTSMECTIKSEAHSMLQEAFLSVLVRLHMLSVKIEEIHIEPHDSTSLLQVVSA